MGRRERSTITYDIQAEQGKRLKEDTSEGGKVEIAGQFQGGKLNRRRGWEEEFGIRKGLQVGAGYRAFSKLLREEAAGDRRRVEIQRKLQRVVINVSLIGLGFGLGWISNWRNPSLAICQCL